MKIVVLDSYSMGTDTPFDALEALGEVVKYDNTAPSQICERIADADVIVLNKIKITEEILRGTKNLKLVTVFATGYDNIDIKAAKELGIGVCNVPGYSTESVTLFTVSTALALYSHLFEYNSFVKSGEYSKSGCANKLTPVYHEISGKTWGIIGCGNIGRAVMRVAKALGAKVIANKRTHTDEFECVDIDTLCKTSDIISIHCPLNESTYHLIDKEKIDLMKRDVVIVNEARGNVVAEADIRDAIEEGRIGAFGCDVYSVEPFGENHPYYQIKDYPNVLLTPHAAWGSYESRKRCVEMIAENIAAFFRGEIKNRVEL